jgi:Uma2 family endonuclease
MKTLLQLGPHDRGRPLTLEEFTSASYQEGYRYELIEGRLHVSPTPNLPENGLEAWISNLLRVYAHEHSDIINYVTDKARVLLPEAEEITAPEPDVAAYQNFPLDKPRRQLKWEDVSPVLVVEVISEDEPEKDLVRNLRLYLQVPSIREYWVIDGRKDADHPTVLVFRRRGQRWQNVIQVGPGESYSTRLLPAFLLTIDPLPGS